MSNDNRALANKSLNEIEEIDSAGTIALTDYVIVSDGNIPKKVKVSVLGTLIANAMSILDLSDTPEAFTDAGDQALVVNTGATAVEFETPTFLGLSDTPEAYVDGDTLKTSAVAVVSTTV